MNILLISCIIVFFLLYLQYKINKWINKRKQRILNKFQSQCRYGDQVLYLEFDNHLNPFYTQVSLITSEDPEWDFEFRMSNQTSYIKVDRYELYPLNWNERFITTILNTIKKQWKNFKTYLQKITTYETLTSTDTNLTK